MTRPPVGLRLAALVLAACSVAWLDPHEHARRGNHLYADGKYDDAAAQYNEALLDQPDSPLVHFNLGDAQYRQGKFADALNAYQEVGARDDEPGRTARVAYNLGNTKYRLGAAAEATDPKAALGLYAEALMAYRRAMGTDPADPDPKFNHEFVEKKIADLQKKLEEQKQQDQQKQEEQKQNEPPPPDQQQQQDQQQGGQKEKDAEQKPDEEEAQRKPDAAPPKPQEGGTPAGADAAEKKDGEMSRQEAAALLDAQRAQEVSPEEITKRLQGGVVAGPAEDW
jgi:Ca-activated chloride channel family protein